MQKSFFEESISFALGLQTSIEFGTFGLAFDRIPLAVLQLKRPELQRLPRMDSEMVQNIFSALAALNEID